MKSACEKAKEWFNRNVFDGSERNYLIMFYDLERLLKEQDRDTRHACADNILKCKEAPCSSFDGSNVIRMEDAHSAVMNTISV